MEAQDYKKLIEALRCCAGFIENPSCAKCAYVDSTKCKLEMMTDAAAAIEELLPKRGEWIEDTTTYAGPGLSNYKCSLCGKICGTWRRGLEPSELPNWCGNCGADMRAKMEVQE